MNRFIFLATATVGLLIAGCNTQRTAAPPTPPPVAPTVQNVPVMPAVPATPGTIDGQAQPPQEENVERVVAKQGVGIKGRSLDQHEGMIVTPVKVYFSVREKTVFEIQIPHALQLYTAGNDGNGPQSHDEFMQHIITENNIKLPQLRPGERYIFNAETQQLMVEKPKPASPAPEPPK